MRLAFLTILGFMIVLPLFAQDNNPEPTVEPPTVTEEPAAPEASSDTESPAYTFEPTGTLPLEVTELLDAVTVFPSATPFLSDTPTAVMPAQTAPFFASDTPAPAAGPIQTETPVATQDVTAASTITAIPVEAADTTPQNMAASALLACTLDTDSDGVVTGADLAAFERIFLYDRVTEVNAGYDLNNNGQIEIGDIQLMAAYLDYVCDD